MDVQAEETVSLHPIQELKQVGSVFRLRPIPKLKDVSTRS
uniref:Uncharacterized protein n=1 Tax=Arundo donax TaxID=35708 RepID=A0A0A8YI91_ARUDO